MYSGQAGSGPNLEQGVCSFYHHNQSSLNPFKLSCDIWSINLNDFLRIKILRGATAPNNQDRLKWLLSDGSTGGLVVSKALVPQP